MDDKMILPLALKGFNDTARPSGIVPTLLVLGFVPRMAIHPDELPNQRSCMQKLHAAKDQMEKLVSKARSSTALHQYGTVAGDKDKN